MVNLALQNGVTQTQYIVNQPDFYPNIPAVTAISSLSGVQLQPTIYQLAPNVRAPYVMQTAIGLERQLGRVGTLAVTYLNSRGVHQFVTINANAPLPGTYNDPTDHPGVRPDPNTGNIYQYTSEGIFKQNQVITNTNLRIGKMFSLFGNYTLSYANANTMASTVLRRIHTTCRSTTVAPLTTCAIGCSSVVRSRCLTRFA